MAEKYPAGGCSTNGKPVLVSPCSSSNEPSPSGSSELQPYSRSRTLPAGNQSSVVVPVRLDVLLFLLNSAARGAQYTLPPESVQGGQGSPSICHHGSATPQSPNCCGCSPTCRSACQPSGAHQYGEDYGRCGGAVESRDNRHGRDGSGQQRDGGWRIPQSPMGWQEKPPGEGRGRDNGDNWQGRRQNSSRSWGERRRGAGDSASWRSGSQDRRRETSAFGSNYTNNKRTQEGCLRPPWAAPEAKRLTDNAQVGWPKGQGTKESTGFPGRPAGDIRGKPAVEESGEDWEEDYEKQSRSSHPDVPADFSKEEDGASTADPPKPSVSTSPLPELGFKAQAVAVDAGKPPVTSRADQSKNGGFVAYLKNLYSDLPKKSSSEGSSDLVIDTDVESSKPDEEERSPEKEAGMEPKSWE